MNKYAELTKINQQLIISLKKAAETIKQQNSMLEAMVKAVDLASKGYISPNQIIDTAVAIAKTGEIRMNKMQERPVATSYENEQYPDIKMDPITRNAIKAFKRAGVI